MFQWFVYDVDVVYDVRDVAICGVFAFNELKLSSSSVCGVLNEFAVGPGCVSDCSDNVWFVVSGFVLCWEDVFWYDMRGLYLFVFVIL